MSIAPLPPAVTDFTSSSRTDTGFEDAVVGGLLGAAALVAQHVALAHEPWRLKRPAAYSVGVSTLGLVFSWWCHRHERADARAALGAWWIIAALGGAATWIAYWLRGRLSDVDARAVYAGQVAGLPRLSRSALRHN